MSRTAPRPGILIVDDEEKIRTILKAILTAEGYEVSTAKDGVEAIEIARTQRPSLLIVDLQMPRMDGIETIVRIRELHPETVAVILTAHGTIQSAVQAIKQGAYDYLTKPFDNDQMVLVVRRAIEFSRLSEELNSLKGQLRAKYGIGTILGDSAVMHGLRDEILRIAATDASVLIEGESGTGKELAARAIHYESRRRDHPMIVVDCTAIPGTLVESEFFGYEAGAFTDAREQRAGKFEEADTGTVFLDEIGELPPEAQAKLLRVLQEKEFNRIGSTAPVRVDVRIIAATNKNLEMQVKSGKFREDLYYRLNVLKLRIPPLREHSEDITLYAHHFLMEYRGMFGKKVSGISAQARQALNTQAWKGNIRELENAMQRAMLSASGDTIEAGDLGFLADRAAGPPLHHESASGLEAYTRSVAEQAERRMILETLLQTHWNRTETAERLRISRKTLFNKMQQYGIKE